MNNTGRIIKYISLFFALALIYSIFKFGFMLIGSLVNGISVDMKIDKVITDLESNKDNYILEVLVGAADVEIIEGDKYSVSTKNKNVEVTETGNLLKVVEKKHVINFSKKKNKIVITIPRNKVFAGIAINGGAGKINISNLVADNVSINTGVGKFKIDNLVSNKYTQIESGVGEFTIKNGSLTNANIEFGVGKVSIKSELIGKSSIESGVGENDITLLGNKDDYRLSLTKGIGTISINGKSVGDNTIYGTGINYLEVSGGIGEININFE